MRLKGRPRAAWCRCSGCLGAGRRAGEGRVRCPLATHLPARLRHTTVSSTTHRQVSIFVCPLVCSKMEGIGMAGTHRKLDSVPDLMSESLAEGEVKQLRRS